MDCRMPIDLVAVLFIEIFHVSRWKNQKKTVIEIIWSVKFGAYFYGDASKMLEMDKIAGNSLAEKAHRCAINTIPSNHASTKSVTNKVSGGQRSPSNSFRTTPDLVHAIDILNTLVYTASMIDSKSHFISTTHSRSWFRLFVSLPYAILASVSRNLRKEPTLLCSEKTHTFLSAHEHYWHFSLQSTTQKLFARINIHY